MPTIIDIPGQYDRIIGSTDISSVADGTLTNAVKVHNDKITAIENKLVTTSKSFTLAAASWTSSNTYTISDTLITTTSNQDFYPAESITASQLEALQLANIVATAQAAGSVTLKAFGDKPTVNIPIKILFRGEK